MASAKENYGRGVVQNTHIGGITHVGEDNAFHIQARPIEPLREKNIPRSMLMFEMGMARLPRNKDNLCGLRSQTRNEYNKSCDQG